MKVFSAIIKVVVLLVVLFVAVLFIDHYGNKHFYRYRFTRPGAIERITGVRFPAYKVVDYSEYLIGHSIHIYESVLEFDSMPDEMFYKALEKNIDYPIDDSLREYDFHDKYKKFSQLGDYSKLWIYGNVYVEVEEGSNRFKVTLMEWPDRNESFKEE
jgi:hypothetical protein